MILQPEKHGAVHSGSSSISPVVAQNSSLLMSEDLRRFPYSLNSSNSPLISYAFPFRKRHCWTGHRRGMFELIKLLSTPVHKYGDVWSAVACHRFLCRKALLANDVLPIRQGLPAEKAAASCRTPNWPEYGSVLADTCTKMSFHTCSTCVPTKSATQTATSRPVSMKKGLADLRKSLILLW